MNINITRSTYMSLTTKDILEGSVYPTTYGDVEVVNIRGTRHVMVRFCSTGYETTTTKYLIAKGKVVDYLYPKYYGKGYLGAPHIAKNYNGHAKEWRKMMYRCYGPGTQHHTVIDEWHSFANYLSYIRENAIYDTPSVVRNTTFNPQETHHGRDTTFVMPLHHHRLLSSVFTKPKVVNSSNGKYYAIIRLHNEPVYLGVCKDQKTAIRDAKRVLYDNMVKLSEEVNYPEPLKSKIKQHLVKHNPY